VQIFHLNMKKDTASAKHRFCRSLQLFNIFFILIINSFIFTGCSTNKSIKMAFEDVGKLSDIIAQANEELNTSPQELQRGDPLNTSRVQAYLQSVLASPDRYYVKAYNRKAFSTVTRKTILMVHHFYVYYKDGEMEHTLVYTGTPRGSERNGTWMLDAYSDVESYNLYRFSDNSWEVTELINGKKKINVIKTTQNILNRIEMNYEFYGGSHIRNLAWYHQIWMYLVPFPVPIKSYRELLLYSRNKDSCTSAVLETIAWY